jgi:hypothetical protein
MKYLFYAFLSLFKPKRVYTHVDKSESKVYTGVDNQQTYMVTALTSSKTSTHYLHQGSNANN